MFSVHRTPRGNALLALLAIALFLGALALLCWDVMRTFSRDTSLPTAVRISNENLRVVSDPKSGWFPYHREPVYDWEDGTQGWLLESEQGLTNSATGSTSPADPDLQPPPSLPTTASGSSAKPSGQKLSVVVGKPSQGKKALSVPVNFPQPATIFRSNSQSGDAYRMVGVRFISYDVYLPLECPGFVGCLFFMKDKDGLWYQARSRAALLPGRWTTVTADIRGGSPDVTPLGHQGQWDDNQATQIRTLGLTFHGDKPFNGTILIDNFRGWVRANKFIQNIATPSVSPTLVADPTTPRNPVTPKDPNLPASPKPKKLSTENLIQLAESYKEPPLSVLNLRTVPASVLSADGKSVTAPTVRKFETLTLRFELNRQVDNPFDPDQADVTCLVTTPSKKVLEHIGFWYQDYDRKDRFAGDELEPIGRPEWRVRITPREEGEYTYVVRVRLKKDELNMPAGKFTATASNARGFVRVSQSDPRFFEFENGEFYYPIGHNLHSPVDMRCWQQILFSDAPAGRGLPMYADFFPKMQKAGENTAEVWMASWWLGIEWTSKWRDYYGKGRYSLQHAWKLDKLLEMARAHNIQIHLVLDNHGKFSTYCDWEWDGNPYNMRADPLNGVCNSAADFFQNEYAKIGHKNKLRYVAARWGADPTVMGFELVSEFDLVGGEGTTIREQRKMSPRQTFHRTHVPQAWVREMIPALKKLDVYDHIVSNHYATDYKWVDSVLAKERQADGAPLFDYIVTDAYRPPQVGGYVLPAVDMQDWYRTKIAPTATKPFWITEYGGDFNAAAAASLDADVHCGLWATWMTEGAGTPLMWWYDFIDQNNLYTYYAGFSKYVAGEDRRGIKGVMSGPHGGGKVDHQIYHWATGAYMWVYDPRAMYSMPPESARKPIEGVQESISGLQPGTYKVEFWNCYTGEIVKTENVQVTGNALPLSFPPFVNNMAVKVKQVPAK